ncbi:hypothetical protein ACL02R_10365 [Streptomyces sp. MS19]
MDQPLDSLFTAPAVEEVPTYDQLYSKKDGDSDTQTEEDDI